MEQLDKTKLSKFWKIIKRLERGVPAAGHIFGNKCEKQVFVERVSNLIDKSPIRIINKTELFRTYDKSGTTTNTTYDYGWGDDGTPVYSYTWKYIQPLNISYHLGWGEEIQFMYIDLITSEISFDKMSWNDMANFKFEYVNTDQLKQLKKLLIIPDEQQ